MDFIHPLAHESSQILEEVLSLVFRVELLCHFFREVGLTAEGDVEPSLSDLLHYCIYVCTIQTATLYIHKTVIFNNVLLKVTISL